MAYDKSVTFLEPTGNIFVDQAQITLRILLKYPNSQNISIQDITDLKTTNTEWSIDWLVNHLTRFKSFTMLFTKNPPLLQNGFKPDNMQIFRAFLTSLIDGIVKQFDPTLQFKPLQCDMCGKEFEYDFNKEYRQVLEANYSKYKPEKEVPRFSTREFFPLAGSMGSESQVFSNMTNPPSICPRCLFVIYYLPFSSQVIEG